MCAQAFKQKVIPAIGLTYNINYREDGEQVRYRVEKTEHHCCSDYKVVDLTKLEDPDFAYFGFFLVCVCAEEEEARLVCDALNASDMVNN